MESRKGELVDLNVVDVRSGRNNVQIEIELIYFIQYLKNLIMCFVFVLFFKIFQCGDIWNFYGLMFFLEMRSIFLFLINENGFNIKINDLILVVYKYCKIYFQINILVVNL